MRLDHTDRLILEALCADARASMATLAQQAHLSRAAVHARFKRLTESGVITGFTARIDAITAGVHASAFVLVTVTPGRWSTVKERLLQHPEVAYLALLSGSEDMLVLVRARDNRELRRVVLQCMHVIPGVQATRTMMIFEDYAESPRWATRCGEQPERD